MVWSKDKVGWVEVVVLSAIVVLVCTNLSLGRYSGGTGDANDPYRIGTPNDLNDIGNHVEDFNKCFVMANDINITGHVYTEALIAPDTNTNSGFQGTKFVGVFDGNGHVISNLSINASTTDYVGLFGYIGEGGEVKSLGVEDANITGYRYAGGLCGYNNSGTITDCYVTGKVNGRGTLGGLCGSNYQGTILNCFANSEVNGYIDLGGLCGHNHGTIMNCYATGVVNGSDGIRNFGGLCGENHYGTITNCYSTGAVNGSDFLGGLCGENHAGTITSCFWDVETSGLMESAGGVGLHTLQMQIMAYYGANDWNDGSWTIDECNDYPRLIGENAGFENPKDRRSR